MTELMKMEASPEVLDSVRARRDTGVTETIELSEKGVWTIATLDGVYQTDRAPSAECRAALNANRAARAARGGAVKPGTVLDSLVAAAIKNGVARVGSSSLRGLLIADLLPGATKVGGQEQAFEKFEEVEALIKQSAESRESFFALKARRQAETLGVLFQAGVLSKQDVVKEVLGRRE